MISITILKNKTENNGFIIKGHSIKARKGNNILCAAVSAISQSTVIGIVNVLNIPATLEKKDGYLYCSIPNYIEKNLKEKTNILILTLIHSLIDIKKQFPNEIEITY